MGSPAASAHIFSSSSSSSLGLMISRPSHTFLKPPKLTLQNPLLPKTTVSPFLKLSNLRTPAPISRATLNEKDQTATTPVLVQEEEEEEQPNEVYVFVNGTWTVYWDKLEGIQAPIALNFLVCPNNQCSHFYWLFSLFAFVANFQPPLLEVKRSVEVLKNAAKTRKVAAEEILSAFSVLEKAKIDPSGFLETLGGTKSPGKTWMLVFTAEKQLKGGKYFPITAVQRFDAAGKRIENGVYLGPLGFLTFEGRLSWKNRILAFIFERIRIKIGPFNPFDINIKGKDESEPSNKNPFFIWFYVDEEIVVARGRSGGTAFWCRCRRVMSY